MFIHMLLLEPKPEMTVKDEHDLANDLKQAFAENAMVGAMVLQRTKIVLEKNVTRFPKKLTSLLGDKAATVTSLENTAIHDTECLPGIAI